MYKSSKLVRGIGIKGDKYPSWNGVEMLKEYSLWTDMLLRCTNKVLLKFPTYEGVTCSENFKSYTFFYEWCNQQKGFKAKDINGKSWHLDKDLLNKGNKTYSEDNCVFIPQRINLLLTKSGNTRGEYLIGVSFDSRFNCFVAKCRKNNKMRFVGHFATEAQAFLAYKTFKEAYIKEVAEQYKDQLDPRAYQALLNYTVEITD